MKNLAFTCAPDQLELLAQYRQGESDLVYRDGKWYLAATCEVPEAPLNEDPLAFEVDPGFAGRVMWLGALTGNVDRSWRNPNVLLWHGRPNLIDHGATLIFHHTWSRADRFVGRPYDASDHVLSASSPDLAAADEAFAPLVGEGLLRGVVALVPDEWLVDEPGFDSAEDVREAYAKHLATRMADRSWLPEVAS